MALLHMLSMNCSSLAQYVYLAPTFPYRMFYEPDFEYTGENNITVKYHFTTNEVRRLMQIVNEYFTFIKTEKLEEVFYDDSFFSNMKNNVWLKEVRRQDTTTLSYKNVKPLESEQKLVLENPPLASFQQSLLPVIKFTNYRSSYSHKKNSNIKFTYDTVLYENVRFVVFSISGLVPPGCCVDSSIITFPENKLNEKCCRSKVVEILFRQRNKLDVYSSLLSNKYVLEDKYYLSQDHKFEEFKDKPPSDKEFEDMLEEVRKSREALTEADFDWE